MPVRRATFGLFVAALSMTLYLALHYVTNSINNAIKQPYMDEIFHVPQAQKYCAGNFTYYDKKLTTPPGLYLLTYVRLWLRDKLLLRRSALVCDTFDLRRTNYLIAIANFQVIVLVLLTSGHRVPLGRITGLTKRISHTIKHSKTADLAKLVVDSIVILLLPPLFFFNSLYYTDAGSVLFTLLAYLFSLNDRHVLAAFSGFISLSFRQTNIVWLFYFACLVILRTLEEYAQRSNSSTQSFNILSPYYILRDRVLLISLIKRSVPYGLVGISFVFFLISNGGIVLGDKEAHHPKLHLAQILYFLAFCSIFGSTWMFNPRILRRFLYFTIRSPLTAVAATIFILCSISIGRYAHPYLLADNRHITFYIWRRILDRHNSYVPYMLTPMYLIASFGVWYHLRVKGCKVVLLYIFCTILVTVPNGLLEPRYFIMPFIILRLGVDTSWTSAMLELCKHLLINASMHYLFLHKTFRWTDSSEVQRIMW